MKQFIIHMGFHKTATTSIQTTCAVNKEKLEELGFYYPLFNLDHRVITNHSIPFYSLFTSEPDKYHMNVRWKVDPGAANKQYEEQLNHILNQEYEKVLISGEDISKLCATELEKMRTKIQSYGYDIRVIVVVRPPLSSINSSIQEMVKNGYSLESINLNHNNNGSQNKKESIIVTKIKTIESVFPQVEFFSFKNLCHHEYGPVGHFFEIIGVTDYSSLEFFRANDSMSEQATRLISFINKEQPLFISEKINPFRKDGDTVELHKLNGDKFQLNKNEFQKFRDGVDQVNQYLLNKFDASFCDQKPYFPLSEREINWSEQQFEQLKNIISEVDENIKMLAYDYCKNIICLDQEKLSAVFFQKHQELEDIELSKNQESATLNSSENQESEVIDSAENYKLEILDTPIYRFQNLEIPGSYLFASEEEAHNIRTNYPDLIEEGVAFYAAIAPNENLIPLYRFQSNQRPGAYLYVEETERNLINADSNLANAFNDEGIAFYVYRAGTGIGVSFSRFQNSEISGTYIYATGAEADSIRSSCPNYIDEGIAFEAAI